MKQLRNIFITLITLLNFNGVGVSNLSLDNHNKSQITEFSQKFYHVSIDNFVEDTTPNEDFDLEEDIDETDEDFVYSTSSKTVIVTITFLQNHSFYYSFSHQYVKKFILYCSLKLHC